MFNPDRLHVTVTNPKELTRQHGVISSIFWISTLLNKLPTQALVLNCTKQIIYCNSLFLEKQGYERFEDVFGVGVGNALRCENSHISGCYISPCEGCKTTESLERTLTFGEDGRELTYEFMNESGGRIFNAFPTLLYIENEKFLLLTLRDVTGEQMDSMLERIFKHDMLNSANNLIGLVHLIRENELSPENMPYFQFLKDISEELINDIHIHRSLLSGRYGGDGSSHQIHLHSFLSEIICENGMACPQKKNLQLSLTDETVPPVRTNKSLLRRIVINMIKNACEAERDDARVLLGLGQTGENEVSIWVKNPSSIAQETQHRIFTSHASPKGSERGLGTYSMKMLAEKYLKGHISFWSDPVEGTVFTLTIPVR